jgi:ketosteroid isomerase-like protein
MSHENVEKVRAGFAAHNRGDLDAWLDLYDPEVEFETLLLGTHQGKEAMRSLYDENQANQSGYTATPVELIDAGDKVITVVQVGGAGTASQIALDDQIAFIQTFKDGLVVREQTFRNREEPSKPPGCRSSALDEKRLSLCMESGGPDEILRRRCRRRTSKS